MLKRLSPALVAALLLTPVPAAAAECTTAKPASSESKQHRRAAAARGNIVQTAVGSPVHTTLVAAVQAAGLADTLSGPGPFTVFAPVNDAFGALPAGTVETLLRPENRDQLRSVLTYHVVPGRVNAAQLTQLIRRGGGHARLKTVQGGTLVARARNGGIEITDAKGRRTRVTQANLGATNGVIHVTDGVFLP
jgi:uncharacterized surface protein with fasciclin (FAS1) repeats